MKTLVRTTAIATLFVAALGMTTAAFAAAGVQEVFVCQLNDGKTMEDLNKVIGEFNKMIGDIKGGDKYTAQVLTPIAARNLGNVIWVGQMPDAVAMATLQENYQGSEAGQKMDEKFDDVITCESRSIWRVHKVR
jgi:ABC-type glycerol-3-phosphate transport system substrate-binding protein